MDTTLTTPRVLHGAQGRPLTLREHEEVFATASVPHDLWGELEASGLTGRGGASFLTSKKVELRRTLRGRHKVVVVNAMEGEPVGHKDRTLLSVNPHLVLDGAEALATLIGATRIKVCVARNETETIHDVQRAMHERERRGAGATLEVHTPPWRYVAGEESALLHWLNDNESLPQYRATRPHVQSVGRSPALVVNAETNAHVGLISRFGAQWFRELGTEQSPGTTLVAVSGAVQRPVVLEVPLGTPLRSILEHGDADPDPRAILLGGYGGTWLGSEHLDEPYCNEVLRPLGASVGAGILVVVPQAACGLTETVRIVEWMANESARQCGPCAFGLPALAKDLATLLRGTSESPVLEARLRERCSVIEGRGACRHPDGVVRLVRSALDVFGDDLTTHARGVPCTAATSGRHWVAVPAMEHESDLVWE